MPHFVLQKFLVNPSKKIPEIEAAEKFKKPKIPRMWSLAAVSNTKENDIFDNEKPDPFGFASQDQNAQANIVVKPKKVEKVFSLGTKTKVGKRV